MEDGFDISKLFRIFVVLAIVGLILAIIFYNVSPLKTTSTDLPYSANGHFMMISGNGEKVLYEQPGFLDNTFHLWLMDRDGSNKTHLASGGDAGLQGMAISDDGTQVAYILDFYDDGWSLISSEIWLLDLTTNSSTLLLSEAQATQYIFNFMDLSFSHNADNLLFVRFDSQNRRPSIINLHIPTKNITEVKGTTDNWITKPIFDSNDDKIYFVSSTMHDCNLYIMDPGGSNIEVAESLPMDTIFFHTMDQPSVNNEENYMVYIQETQFASGGMKFEIFLTGIDGTIRAKLFKVGYTWGAPIQSLKISPDGSQIHFIEGSKAYTMEYNWTRFMTIYVLKLLSTGLLIAGVIGLAILEYKKRQAKKKLMM